MKTIAQVVEAEIPEITQERTEYYTSLINNTLYSRLIRLNRAKADGKDYRLITAFLTKLNDIRANLKGAGLWGEEYETAYQAALKGELNEEKLSRIRIK